MATIERVGHGYDLHRLSPGRRLVLAGVHVPWKKGLLGHSDADVVLHAVIDALLGAAGLGDIGQQFPDSDNTYKDIDSSVLMTRTMEKINQAGFAVVNVDVTIIAEQPKLGKYKDAMRKNLAQLVRTGSDVVSIKAKTNEGLGDIGKGQAIACMAIVGLSVV